ncbi:hypothetical protein LXA43DRAFT_1027845 [Ganoderma leucocontextum]|nr:hypothetical protein LXA43DRAFT_1027845 [Ganoderma leucocontextum]
MGVSGVATERYQHLSTAIGPVEHICKCVDSARCRSGGRDVTLGGQVFTFCQSLRTCRHRVTVHIQYTQAVENVQVRNDGALQYTERWKRSLLTNKRHDSSGSRPNVRPATPRRSRAPCPCHRSPQPIPAHVRGPPPAPAPEIEIGKTREGHRPLHLLHLLHPCLTLDRTRRRTARTRPPLCPAPLPLASASASSGSCSSRTSRPSA